MSKFEKYNRTTNLIEAAHSVFNKSTLLPKNGYILNIVQGLQIIDLEFRAIAVDFFKNGVTSLPKKSQLYQDREKKIHDGTENWKNESISNDEFLEECAKTMINEIITEATINFENRDADQLQSLEEEQIEFIEAIFSQSSVNNKRVKKVCSKYFGESWINF